MRVDTYRSGSPAPNVNGSHAGRDRTRRNEHGDRADKHSGGLTREGRDHDGDVRHGQGIDESEVLVLPRVDPFALRHTCARASVGCERAAPFCRVMDPVDDAATIVKVQLDWP